MALPVPSVPEALPDSVASVPEVPFPVVPVSELPAVSVVSVPEVVVVPEVPVFSLSVVSEVSVFVVPLSVEEVFALRFTVAPSSSKLIEDLSEEMANAVSSPDFLTVKESRIFPVELA